ncbi:ADP-ribosylglycohydrolase [Brevibacillus reuszeri]|uniref:ADP-ribosylglycohydrolase n=1 Tax=Brevibacillus reuszeri TaxID=54915 RepID=A0A0K9YQ43_9BACL|nr:ADP-ribosylglycohydrolase family protein [Brevibacillus reuszeri]KNB70300.1 ADP-ribosylglycohydrolase [Brevibacillus reuszeri]MED1859263.1 ADP-ribosylglycohydrolase family protein [Brevibacillus reuszeri]GED72241.1 ADP-ribosylglycohydrolase [Brevibacillus reuszeri]
MLTRFQGSLIGLAVGDAIGTTVEFKKPGTFQKVTDMVGGGVFDLPKGCWTDDTSMALCISESLIAHNGFNPIDQMERYVKWYRHGHLSSIGECFDIGNATAEALQKFERTGDPFCGSDNPYSAGNGSIMRLAPVPLYFSDDLEEAVKWSALSSRTTHAAKECVDACRLFGAMIAAAARGMDKEELLQPHTFDPLWGQEALAPKIADISKGTYKHLNPPEIQGSGYVVKSLEAALWAFYHGESFEEGVLLAVNLGDDADTTGAIYGQLAGAHYGIDAIPERWIEPLAMKELILDMARKLQLKG